MMWIRGTAVRMNTFNNLARVAALSLFVVAASAQDPPSRVARLNYIQGNVSMQPASVDDWSQAIVNRPFTIGDYLYTDDSGQAELHMDVAVIRMGPQTNFGFLNLDDQTVQIKLTEGSMSFRIRNFYPGQVFEVDTPNAAFTLLREGTYRFNVDPNANTSFVVVREGQAEVTGGGQAFTLNPGNSAFVSGTDQLAYDVEVAPDPDQFDSWCSQRDYREAHLQSFRYVSPNMIGYEDLDDNGDWQPAPGYGTVWYPRGLSVGWAPYHNGHWAWVQPWGWTWVDDAPWGFAPFHYGRWAYIGGRWGWCPGPVAVVGVGGGPVVRVQYAPALVAFFGGAHFGVSLSIGGGGASMGWVPLGFGEVYTPPYRVSQAYFTNVNVSSTTINRNVNITNVYNTTYVNNTTIVNNTTTVNNHYANMSAPGAVTAMPQSSFASGRPVAQNAVSLPPAQVAKIQPGAAAVLAPAVAPTRQALTPVAGSGPVPHPPAPLMARQVTAKQPPPPPPPSFAAQQSFIQKHPGQPLNAAAIRQAAPVPPVAPAVRQAPVAKAAVPVRPGQHIGNQSAFTRPAAQPGPIGKPAAEPPAKPAALARPAPIAPAPSAHGAPPNLQQKAVPLENQNARRPEAVQPALSPRPANPELRAHPPAEPAPPKPELRPAPAPKIEPKVVPPPKAVAPPPHGTPPPHPEAHPAPKKKEPEKEKEKKKEPE